MTTLVVHWADHVTILVLHMADHVTMLVVHMTDHVTMLVVHSPSGFLILDESAVLQAGKPIRSQVGCIRRLTPLGLGATHAQPNSPLVDLATGVYSWQCKFWWQDQHNKSFRLNRSKVNMNRLECWNCRPLVSTGVLVLLVTMLGARSREMSRNGSTVVDTVLAGCLMQQHQQTNKQTNKRVNKERKKERKTERNKQTHKDTNKQAHTHTNKQTNKQLAESQRSPAVLAGDIRLQSAPIRLVHDA